VKPSLTQKLDFEAELVAVIGKTCKQIKPSQAAEHIVGYTVGHDVTARDWQKGKPGGQWILGKSFDTFCPIGPYISVGVPIDVAQNLGIRCFLNGEKMQDSNTKEMIFTIDHFISYLSQVVTLKPGDLIFTGTPSGVGIGRSPPLFMKPGDSVKIEIDQLGSITNPVIAPSKL